MTQLRRALIVVGKAPQPGKTKTRLVPPLSTKAAAELYRGFLLDAVKLGLDLGWDRVTVVHPYGAAPALQPILPNSVQLLEQTAAGLGAALASAFAHHFNAMFDRVLLIGSDNPTLTVEPIHEACAALDDGCDVSIGPSIDGGYYLIGLRAPHLGVFEHIDWSTPRVYAQTLTRAKLLGLRAQAVAEWYDVDEPADLLRLQRELQTAPLDVAPHTRVALERLRASGFLSELWDEQRRRAARLLGVRASNALTD